MSYTEEYCGDPEGTAETVGKIRRQIIIFLAFFIWNRNN